MKDRIEFYNETDGPSSRGLIAAVESSLPLKMGDRINIRKRDYEVITASFVLDDADDGMSRRLVQTCRLKVI